MSEWEKLWAKGASNVMEYDPESWYQLVKAVGDALVEENHKLREKADKWDEFVEAYKDRWVGKGLNEDQASHQAWQIVSSWVQANRELEQKLEAIRAIITTDKAVDLVDVTIAIMEVLGDE